MSDAGYSQLPVENTDKKVVGVFSWRSFASRALDFRGKKVDLADMQVKDCMEEAVFISPETYIDTDTATDWGQIDFVLVGSADHLIGILTVSDVFGRLNDFAEAFVLIYEIEHTIREILQGVISEPYLQKLFAEYSKPQSKPVQSLLDMSFGDYLTVLCAKERYPQFEPILGQSFSSRDFFNKDMRDVNDLRNDVFHFRRQITTRETDRLHRFREKLRFARTEHEKKISKPAAATNAPG